MSMASNSFFDQMFEIVQRHHIDETSDEITIPALDNGSYVLVMSPNITTQDAIGEGVRLGHSAQLLIYANNNSVLGGPCFVYQTDGSTNYWTLRPTYADSRTKINLKIGSNNEAKFMGDHDLYVIKVK